MPEKRGTNLVLSTSDETVEGWAICAVWGEPRRVGIVLAGLVKGPAVSLVSKRRHDRGFFPSRMLGHVDIRLRKSYPQIFWHILDSPERLLPAAALSTNHP